MIRPVLAPDRAYRSGQLTRMQDDDDVSETVTLARMPS